MIDLNPKYIEFIKNTVGSVLSDFELYIFGSRARGNAKEYSDIDIAIKSAELNNKTKSQLEFLFEDSTLPYEVDIINLGNISEQFKKVILDNLVKIV